MPYTFRLISLCFFSVFCFNQPAGANVFEDLYKVATDPLKLSSSSKELAGSLERTMLQINALESVANGHARDRLEQVRSILGDVIIGSQQTIDKATADMLVLEKAVDADAIRLIYRAQCAFQETLNDGRKAFADVVADLGEADPAIHVFGLKIIDVKSKKIEIVDPDAAYRDVKAKRLLQSRIKISDQTDAYEIVSTYANLHRMAKLTMCYYLDSSTSIFWVKEMNSMDRLADPWTTVVSPQL